MSQFDPNASNAEGRGVTYVPEMPRSDDAEKGVLSCFLQNPVDLLNDAQATLPPAAFYHVGNRVIYEELLGMNSRGRTAIDLVLFTQHLIDKDLLDKVGGAGVLAELTNFVPTAAHYPYYRGIMRDKYLLRCIIGACTDGIQQAYQSDHQENPMGLLNHVDELFLSVRTMFSQNGSEGPRPLSDITADVIDDLERAMRNKGKILGILTGIPDLDRMINGLEPPDLFFIGARPGMGKTNLMIILMFFMAVTQIEARIPALCFSLEMTDRQLVRRALLSEAGILQSKGRTGMFSSAKVHGENSDERKLLGPASIFQNNTTLWIDDTPGMNIAEICARIRQMKRKHGIRVVFLDYTQMVRPITKAGFADKKVAIEEVCEGLKATAKQCNIVIIALAQAGRGSEENPGSRPKLRDFDGSSAIDKFADFAGMIHRPSKYKNWDQLKDKEKDYYGTETTFIEAAELIMVKGRECGEGIIPLRFIGELARFEPKTTKLFSNNPSERQTIPPDDEEIFQ